MERHLRGPLSAELSGFTYHDIIASPDRCLGMAKLVDGPRAAAAGRNNYRLVRYDLLDAFGLIGAYFGKNNVG